MQPTRTHQPGPALALVSVVVSGLLAAAWAAPLQAQQGIYFDDHRPGDIPPKHLDHPHVDGVLLRFAWSQLEPQPGRYDFEPIDRQVAPWAAANKKVILGIVLTAQREGYTPEWVYGSGRVRAIEFVRTGKNVPVRQAKCWDPRFLGSAEGVIRAFAARYGDDEHIEAVLVGPGHLGFIVAAPNPGGARAFLAAGWTPERWIDYCLALAKLYRTVLPHKPLLMRGSALVLRMPNPARAGFPGHARHFTDVRDTILLRAAAEHGISIGGNGLEADAEAFLRTGVPALFARLGEGALEGRYRLELSDDWPIWVPPQKRSGVNRGKDNAYFKACLENAIGGVRGIPPTNISFMKMLDVDLQCTDPRSRLYQPDCEEALKRFKSKLRDTRPRR